MSSDILLTVGVLRELLCISDAVPDVMMQNGPSCSGTNVAAMNNAWQLAQLAQHATQHQHPGA